MVLSAQITSKLVSREWSKFYATSFMPSTHSKSGFSMIRGQTQETVLNIHNCRRKKHRRHTENSC
jgi:hypothetical protein